MLPKYNAIESHMPYSKVSIERIMHSQIIVSLISQDNRYNFNSYIFNAYEYLMNSVLFKLLGITVYSL